MAEEDTYIQDAMLAESIERYEDMAKFMKEYVTRVDKDKGLSPDQRNLLSVAYKNVVGTRRSAWRVVSSMESKSKDDKLPLKEYKAVIEEELKTICTEVIDLLDDYLIVDAGDDVSKSEACIFFKKMKGDYFRYLCEVADGNERDEPVDKAAEAYASAHELAEQKLGSTHPIRLGLALNFSVFHYEIKNEQGKACKIAKEAFDNAIAELDTLKEDSYKDSTLIMQLLRDNLTLWTSDNPEEDEEPSAN